MSQIKLVMMIVLTLGLASAANVFGQRKKTAGATNRTANLRVTAIKQAPQTQIFLDGGNDSWNTRQKPKNKTKAKSAVKRTRTIPSFERRTKPVRNLQSENGGLDTTPEKPAFGDASARKNSSPTGGTQSNILPYIEQQTVIKRPAAANRPTSTGRKRTN
jgi:hypothetical protein